MVAAQVTGQNLNQLQNKIILINDGCHGLGAEINNKITYAIRYADYVTYGFHPVKPIT